MLVGCLGDFEGPRAEAFLGEAPMMTIAYDVVYSGYKV